MSGYTDAGAAYQAAVTRLRALESQSSGLGDRLPALESQLRSLHEHLDHLREQIKVAVDITVTEARIGRNIVRIEIDPVLVDFNQACEDVWRVNQDYTQAQLQLGDVQNRQLQDARQEVIVARAAIEAAVATLGESE